MRESFPVAEGVRVDWVDLPRRVHAHVESVLGARVVESRTARGGFSPGVASTLVLDDGELAFVKAVHPSSNPHTPAMHLREASLVQRLPGHVPAPRVRDVCDVDGYVVATYSHVSGRQPSLPWNRDEVDVVVSAIERLVASLTPAPCTAPTLADMFGASYAEFAGLLEAGADDLDPWIHEHLDELVAIESTWVSHADGETLLHCDLRADNMLVDGDHVTFVDWAHACIGPGWFDLLALLPSVAMQGGPKPWDVFDRSELGRDAPPEAVDALLCMVAGLFVAGARRPAPPGLPTLRPFQHGQGVEATAWLRHRLESH